MRLISLICTIVLFFSVGFAQDQTDAQNKDAYSVSDVMELVKMEDDGFSSSWWEKANFRLGDRASIALLKLYNEAALKDPKMIKKYLPVLRKAFFDISMVQIVEDRKPLVTMFLLNYLQREVTDKSTKVQISEAIRYIKAQTGKSLVR